jgi:hypothetical protein
VLNKRMKWTRQIPKFILLSDGRTIGTLGEARDVMLELSPLHQSREHWRSTAELLLRAAADSEKTNAITDAQAQLTRALKAEGLI